MTQVFLELKPHVSTEVFSILMKYSDHKRQLSQEMLLMLEKKNPSLAAQLDKLRPSLSPSDED